MYTEDEAVNNLKSRLADIEDEDRYKLENDMYLYYWLKCENFNIDKTEAAIRKAFKYRKENKMNTSNIESDFPHDVFNHFPVFLDGLTKSGETVVSMDVGCWDVKSFVNQHGDGSRMVRYFELIVIKLENMWLEINSKRLKEQGGKFLEEPTSVQFIVSLNNWSMKQIMGTKLVDTYIRILKAATNVIPVLKKVSFINTIKLFSVCLNIIKPFLSSQVIEVHGLDQDKWRQHFEQNCALDMTTLRPNYGGTRTDEISPTQM